MTIAAYAQPYSIMICDSVPTHVTISNMRVAGSIQLMPFWSLASSAPATNLDVLCDVESLFVSDSLFILNGMYKYPCRIYFHTGLTSHFEIIAMSVSTTGSVVVVENATSQFLNPTPGDNSATRFVSTTNAIILTFNANFTDGQLMIKALPKTSPLFGLNDFVSPQSTYIFSNLFQMNNASWITSSGVSWDISNSALNMRLNANTDSRFTFASMRLNNSKMSTKVVGMAFYMASAFDCQLSVLIG